MNLPRLATLLTLLLVSLSGAADDHARIQQPYAAEYVLKKAGLTVAEGRFTLVHAGNGLFTFETESSAAGVVAWFSRERIIERTAWRLADGAITPQRYSFHQSGSDERRVDVTFDREAGRITTTVNDDPWRMELVDGVQDKLSVQLSLQLDLMRGKREGFDYPVADGGTLKHYRFVYEGEERVETPLGSFDTLRVRREGDKRGTTIWFAPALNYIPVVLEQKKKRARLVIRSLDGQPLLPLAVPASGG